MSSISWQRAIVEECLKCDIHTQATVFHFSDLLNPQVGKPTVCIWKTLVLSRCRPLKTSCYDFSGRELSKLAGEYNVSDDTELCKAS